MLAELPVIPDPDEAVGEVAVEGHQLGIIAVEGHRIGRRHGERADPDRRFGDAFYGPGHEVLANDQASQLVEFEFTEGEGEPS